MNIKFRRRYLLAALASLVIVAQFAITDQPPVDAGIFDASSPESYAEIWVPHTNLAGFSGGCGGTATWYIEPEPGCSKTLTVSLPADVGDATRSELFLNIWAGREAQRVRYSLNGGPAITVQAGYENSRTPVVLSLDVNDLVAGANTLEFSSLNNKYHIHDAAFRLYGLAGSYPEVGGLTGIGGVPPAAGGVLDVTGTETITLTATIPGADRVEFIAYYDGFDEDNDGETLEWHAISRQNFNPGGDPTGRDPNGNPYVAPATGGTIGHIGTVANNGIDDNYTIDWDTSLITTQTGVKFKARAVSEDAGTRLNVADAVGGESAAFSISRSTYIVESFSDDDFFDALIHANGQPDETTRVINLPLDQSDWQSATHQGLYWQNPFVEWNGGLRQTAFINDEDVWGLSAISIPLADIQPGANSIEYSYNSNTTTGNNRTGTLFGQHIEEPGARLVVRRAGAVRIYEEPQSQNAIDGQQVTLAVEASGLATLSYQWTVDNVAIPAETNPTYTFGASDALQSAVYRVEVTNGGGTLTSQPATVTVLAEAFVTDDFSDPAASALLWDEIDALGGGAFSYTGAQAVISVPEDTIARQPWTSGNQAPTLRQTMSDTDFDLMVAFDSVPDERFELQGVIVAGPGQYLRFDLDSDGTDTYAFAARIAGGSATKFVDSVPIPVDHTGYLRVKREGDLFTMYTSNDGSSWVERGSFMNPMTVSEFGPFGGNATNLSGTAPEFHAIVDYVGEVPMTPQADDDSQPPAITGIDIIEGPTSLIVNWTTSEPTTGTVEYLVDGLLETRSSGGLSYTHQVLILGLGTETTYALDIIADDINANTTTNSTSGTTTETGVGDTLFDVWYGDEQDFGTPGSTQRWVNVLGRVSDPQGLDTLEARLNGGAWRNLSIGPDDRRLRGVGDFNVDILTSDLLEGANIVEIRATDTLAEQTNHTVTVNWTANSDFPIPYVLDWNTVTAVNEVVVPIDGYWNVSPDGLSINNVDDGYDRIAAFGEQTWEQYEVLVPITVNSIAPGANQGPSFGPGVGFIVRWNGHNDEHFPGSQPQLGFQPLDDGFPTPFGAIAWWRNAATLEEGLQILDESAVVVATDTGFDLELGTQYMFRVRVEGTTPATYRLKVWDPAAEEEPGPWSLEWTAPGNNDEPTSGSLTLLAHEVDALFGDVVVIPAGATSADAPSIVPGTSVIDDGTTVSITSPDPDAAIYYTTDDSTPDPTSALYTSPFTLAADATVRAISYVPNEDPSPVSSESYIVNFAPVVEAGSALTLAVGQTGALGGSVTDAPTPGPVTATWSVVSGPGATTFGDPTSATSTVVFDTAGSYTLRLTGSDTRLSATDDVTVAVNAAGPPLPEAGYWMIENDGTLYPFGDAEVFAPINLDGADVVSIVTTNGTGVWVLDSTGKVHVRGTAAHHGDMTTAPVTLVAGEAITAFSVKVDGSGYWLFTNRGRAIPYGSAEFYGDATNLALLGDVIASVATTTGLGYYMVGSDGGIFAFGDAVFYGSVPQFVPISQLAAPLVGIATDPDGAGYWIVGADGGIFAFDAPFVGSVPGVLGAVSLNEPVIGALAFGDGYLAVASDGGIFNFSTLAFFGSLGGVPLDTPIKGVAAFAN